MNDHQLQDLEQAARAQVSEAEQRLLAVLKRRVHLLIKQEAPTAVGFDVIFETDDDKIYAAHVNIYDGEELLDWNAPGPYDVLRELLDEVFNLMRHDDPAARALYPHEGPTSLEVLLAPLP